MRPFEAAHPEIETVAHQKCQVNSEERTHAECNQSDEDREKRSEGKQGQSSCRAASEGTFKLRVN